MNEHGKATLARIRQYAGEWRSICGCPACAGQWLAIVDAERQRADRAVELLREIEQRINLHAMIRHSSDCVIVIRTPLLTEACTCGWRAVLARIDGMIGGESHE